MANLTTALAKLGSQAARTLPVVGGKATSVLSNLAGTLGGKLAQNSGSTLSGILGRSSGLILPNATPKA